MLITAKRLGHQFSGNVLFRDLSFTLNAGDVVALTGPSGSGKSTLLSILAGWLKPHEGEIESCVHTTRWVFQNPIGSPHRTVLDHVSLPLLATGATRPQAEEQAHQILTQFGLAALSSRLFGQLSGGEAQRLMLARAVAGPAELLLVDEPTAQLDRAAARSVIDRVNALAGAGGATVIATHDAELARACGRVLSLDSDIGSHQ